MKTKQFPILICTVIGCSLSLQADDAWKPVPGIMKTQWANQVNPDNVWPQYPRPQLMRDDWQNLNGLWDFALTDKNAAQPATFAQKILVPFPAESALSGIGKKVTDHDVLWYHKTLKIKGRQPGKRVLLNFEAVDFEATVWVNGHQVGNHEGGYEPFSFDITDALGGSDSADLVVKVYDATGQGQPVGKQAITPGGIRYTASSGIWFTVWLEQVPALHITQINTVTLPGLDGLTVTVAAEGEGSGSASVKIEVFGANKASVASGSGLAGQPIAIKIPEPKLWLPESPTLYDLKVTLDDDIVKSYAGLRTVEKRKDAKGINRFFLNGHPIFMSGTLDQGWWPDGLYTPPSEAAMRYDLDFLKSAGFNMLRKHIKVEPRVYYRACDELGLMVWQDTPSGDNTDRGKTLFKAGLVSMINELRNHPSIMTWIIFNEGWGQDDDKADGAKYADKVDTRTAELTELARSLDPTRIIDSVTGWKDRKVGDMTDCHTYAAVPGMKAVEPDRISVLGEFGGIGFPVEGHLWNSHALKIYTGASSQDDLLQRFTEMYLDLFTLKSDGLAASVYTQTTDVEGEDNGLMTYDRAVAKIPAEKIAPLNRLLTVEGLTMREILPIATSSSQSEWHYTTQTPPADWTSPSFAYNSWQTGRAGFGGGLGDREMKEVTLSTDWKTADIWLEKTFVYDGAPLINPRFKVFYDDDVEIYVNGKLVLKRNGAVSSYVNLAPSDPLSLAKGENTIIVHCHNAAGGQFIDVGLYDLPATK